MIAVETNILVFSTRPEHKHFAAADHSVRTLVEGDEPWGLPWPCIHEFLGIVTHPGIYKPPTPMPVALSQVEAWLRSPRVILLAESSAYWATIRSLCETSNVRGGMIHDAKIAAICLTHGVRELWTADRDFERFPSLKTRNPLIP